MPSIEGLLKEPKKKFKKSNYRPWNYLDEIQKEKEQLSQSDVEEHLEDKAQNSQTVSLGVIEATGERAEASLSIERQITPVLKATYKEINRTSTKNHIEIAPDLTLSREEKETNETASDKIFRLTGHQKNLFFFIYERCISRGMLSTGPLTNETLTSATKIALKMLKLSIQRLVEKCLIIREKGKTGRGGFYNFSLTMTVRNAATEYNKLITMTNLETGNKANDEDPEILHIQKDLPHEWQIINYEALKDIGFNKEHIIQIYKLNRYESKIIQNSIDYYAYDLQHNNKSSEIKKTPIAYFMGILKNNGPYTPPSNYESVEDKAMRQYIEKQEIINKKRIEIEEKAKSLDFQKWLKNTDIAVLQQQMPAGFGKHEKFKNAWLKEYHEKEIWPKTRSEILKDNPFSD